MARARHFPHDQGFTANWRGWPPHMVPAERELMYWWLSRPTTTVDEIWYDVPLDGEDPRTGTYPAAAEILNPTELRTWYSLTARRADAIARTGPYYTLIELRDTAGPQTLGEILLYQHLATTQHAELQWRTPTIIARNYSNGILTAARAQKIQAINAPSDLYDPAKLETRYTPTVSGAAE